jgi:hypothetical protein
LENNCLRRLCKFPLAEDFGMETAELLKQSALGIAVERIDLLLLQPAVSATGHFSLSQS